jgi:hypothetical protein
MTDAAEWDGEDDNVLEEPETFFGSVDEFVREFLIFQYRREVSPKGEFRWDPRWWMHPEAASRLDALWRTWEHFRNDGAIGMSIWWRDHADHHMGVLLSLAGPFARTSGTTDFGDPLPYTAPPPGLYPDVRSI